MLKTGIPDMIPEKSVRIQNHLLGPFMKFNEMKNKQKIFHCG